MRPHCSSRALAPVCARRLRKPICLVSAPIQRWRAQENQRQKAQRQRTFPLSADIRSQHVFSTSLVRARKFYGFYGHESLFIRIALINPSEAR